MVAAYSVSKNPFAQSAHYQQLTLIAAVEAVPMVETALEDLVFSMAHFEHFNDAAPTRISSLPLRSDYAEYYEGRLESIAEIWRTDAVVGDSASRAEVDTRLLLLKESGVRVFEWQWQPLEMKDWVSEIQSQFPPLSVGRFFIHGEHIEGKQRPIYSLKIGAGCAFGTGEHGTTASCLRALQWLSHRRRPQRILDLGCGTGILAIAAKKLWPEALVVGSDMDNVAVQVAKNNARANAVPKIPFYRAAGFRNRPLQRSYEVVVANILARPLMYLAADITQHLEVGGYAILSGLLTHQEKEVRAAYHARGMKWVKTYRQDSWSAMVLKRLY